MQIYLRKATMDDAAAVMDVINQAKAFLKSYHSPQWQDGHPTWEMVKDDIAKGYTYVLMVDGDIAGTAALKTTSEPNYDAIYDGQWQRPNEPYAIIHRVAFTAKYRGHHLSSYLFSNIISIGYSQGIRNFRYDTHQVNLPMQKLGEGMGFVRRGTINVKDKIDHVRMGYELNL